ncbi:MAG: hypothetical protein CSB28_00395 [Desulfobacterales bacterium]|nr:MAG: hypothetical protein CSB28_00395 [Desulfobacterales bacterium]
MIITCEQCATKYFMAEERVKSTGTKMRCSKCQHVFVAFPSQASHHHMGAAPSFESANTTPGLAKPPESALSGFDDMFGDSPGFDLPMDDASQSGYQGVRDGNLSKSNDGQADGVELPDLANELDKILGTDPQEDDLFSQNEGKAAAMDPNSIGGGSNQSLDDYDELDNLLDTDAAGGKKIEQQPPAAVPPAEKHEDIEVLDLTQLEAEEPLGELPESDVDDFDALFADKDDQEVALTDQNDDFGQKTSNIGLDTIQIDDFDADFDDLDDIGFNESDTTDVPEEKNDLPADHMDTTDDGESIELGSEEAPPDDDASDEFELDLDDFDLEEKEEISEKDAQSDLDKDNIESLDLESDAPDKMALAGETADESDQFILDGDNIDALDLDLDEPGEKAIEEETSDENDQLALDGDNIDSLDLDLDTPGEAAPEENASGEDDQLALDGDNIDSLDLDLDTPGEAAPGEDASDEDDQLALDGDNIDSLDLDLDTPGEAALTEESTREDVATPDLGEPEAPIATEAGTPSPEDSKEVVSKALGETKSEKKAEVLNLDLERPDLDGDVDSEEGIDLPILDDLLAPAEVTDETLIEPSLLDNADSQPPAEDDGLTSPQEAKPDEVGAPVLEMGDADDGLNLETEAAELNLQGPDEAADEPSMESAAIEEEAPKTAEPERRVTATERPVAPGKFETVSRRGPSKLLIILLVIVLLIALLFGLKSLGVKIPYVSNLNIPFLGGGGQQEAIDPGNTRMKTVDIKGKFIKNQKSGQLLVITGKVSNQYKDTRGAIQVVGHIYANNGKVTATKWVYCGNLLSDADLTSKPFEEINRQLTNKQGRSGAGKQNLRPGQTLPFMIVFDKLPANIEEFSVEVARSVAIK